jgi:hypothetical protein
VAKGEGARERGRRERERVCDVFMITQDRRATMEQRGP